MIKKIFSSASHLKVLLFLYKLENGKRTNSGKISQATKLSYPTIQKILSDFRKAKIIVIIGATKSQRVMVAQSRPKKVIWKFIDDLDRSYYL